MKGKKIAYSQGRDLSNELDFFSTDAVVGFAGGATDFLVAAAAAAGGEVGAFLAAFSLDFSIIQQTARLKHKR